MQIRRIKGLVFLDRLSESLIELFLYFAWNFQLFWKRNLLGILKKNSGITTFNSSGRVTALKIFENRFARKSCPLESELKNERGDVPGWVLVVLMTAGLVTGIWSVAAPRLNQILRNSLDSMNVIR